MSKVAILTDSNSGITQAESKELGVFVEPMPFYIDGELYYEDIDLTQDEFYQKLTQGGEIKTSMPITGNLMDTWEKILEDYDELVHTPENEVGALADDHQLDAVLLRLEGRLIDLRLDGMDGRELVPDHFRRISLIILERNLN